MRNFFCYFLLPCKVEAQSPLSDYVVLFLECLVPFMPIGLGDIYGYVYRSMFIFKPGDELQASSADGFKR